MIESVTTKHEDSERLALIITGLSGAGKTSVMRSLEDLGFYCVDNLPLPLLPTFLKLAFSGPSHLFKVALGIDARGEQFLQSLAVEVQQVKATAVECALKIIFVSAQHQTLLKRFQETRRKHPLANSISVEQAIEREKKLMEPLMSLADVVLETDGLPIHELRRLVSTHFAQGQQRELTVNLVSFGFKYGVPAESNLVYDLRFLPNPYFTPALKDCDGRNTSVHDFLFSKPVVQDYWQQLAHFLQYMLTRFHEEGRFCATVALGCTGGKHRSVAFVEKIGQQSWPNIRFCVTHRDVGKE
jgi:RNase adapter protein RapZ